MRPAALALALLVSLPALAGSRVQVPRTRVSVEAPLGLAPDPRYQGFQGKGASLLVTELPEPVSLVLSQLTPELLQRRGLTLLGREPARFGDLDGVLLRVEQRMGTATFRKWHAVFGDAKGSVVVMATYRDTQEAEQAEPLKRAVLSARRERAGVGRSVSLAWALTDTSALRIAGSVKDALAYSTDGRTGAQPLLLVSTKLAAGEKRDAHALAQALTQRALGLTHLTQEFGAPLEVDGLPGYELVARGRDTKGRPQVLYQLVLRATDGYVLAQGAAPEAERTTWLPRFRTSARSFRGLR